MGTTTVLCVWPDCWVWQRDTFPNKDFPSHTSCCRQNRQSHPSGIYHTKHMEINIQQSLIRHYFIILFHVMVLSKVTWPTSFILYNDSPLGGPLSLNNVCKSHKQLSNQSGNLLWRFCTHVHGTALCKMNIPHTPPSFPRKQPTRKRTGTSCEGRKTGPAFKQRITGNIVWERVAVLR